jgi:hypothetical protein
VTLPALGPWIRDEEPGVPAGIRRQFVGVTPVPAGQPVLFADDYGFHYGYVWYRGSRHSAWQMMSPVNWPPVDQRPG